MDMRKITGNLLMGGALLGAGGFAQAGPATVTILHTFVGATDGDEPEASPIQGPDGTLYGTASSFGPGGGGTVYRIDPDGTFTVLHAFPGGKKAQDGSDPQGGLVLGTDGLLYGTTFGGGANGFGTVFRLATDGSAYILLYSFAHDHKTGWSPKYSLVQASDGNFYGTTYSKSWETFDCAAGADIGCGAVFKITPDGVFTLLHRFDVSTEGFAPAGALVVGKDGNLYGANTYGAVMACPGGAGCGTLYRVTLKGNFELLHTFQGPEGGEPWGALIRGSGAELVGLASAGGTSGAGTAFTSTEGGIVQDFYDFTGLLPAGLPSTGLTLGSDGNYYGGAASPSPGDIYRLKPGGSAKLMYGQIAPNDALTAGNDGLLYGVSGNAVTPNVVFSMNIPSTTVAR